ncbi:hypothetical protein, partial [Deinococcus sp.]|uniref:hypothetical protein n=1 Tax=Deinococcus sp. TaxID=47478 RepID=UPI003918D0E6
MKLVLVGLGQTLLALAKNPIVLLATALTGLVVAWVRAADSAEESRRRMAVVAQALMGIVDVAKGVYQSVVGLFSSLGHALGTIWQAITAALHGQFGEAWAILQRGLNLEQFAARFEAANRSLVQGASMLGATLR